MSDYNMVILLGRLGKDPEVRFMPDGKAICSFSLATGKEWVKDGKKESKTEWHNIVCFGKTAEACGKYLKKGSKVLIVGRLNATAEGNPRTWQDSSGNTRASFEVNADEVKFLSSRSDGTANHEKEQEEDSIPF